MKTVTANYKPTQIQFGDEYDGDKLRRLAQSVVDLGNQLAIVNKAGGGGVPTGGTNGQVLTWLPSTGAPGWAAAQVPSSFPWASLTGVPSSFTPSQHVIASTTNIGPAHAVSGLTQNQVLLAIAPNNVAFQFLNYSQLGDVDTGALADGYVPAWNQAAAKWQMVPNGGGFSGLTPGTVYIAVNPTTAQFLPLLFTNIAPGSIATPAQVGSTFLYPASFGAGDPKLPTRDFAGTSQWNFLNKQTAFDSLLTGDGNWRAIRDIEISWAQLSDVPQQLPPLSGKRTQYLSGAGSWETAAASSGGGSSTPSFSMMWGDDGMAGDDGMPMPGVQGAPGGTGPTGSAGFGAPIPGDDGAAGDDGFPMPGIQGVPGVQGFQGSQGPWMHADDGNAGDDAIPMPGIQGPPGVAATAPQALPHWADDGSPGDDAMPMPGIQGAQGIQGIQGSPSIHFWADDGNPGDDAIPMPGIQGAPGTIGVNGVSGYPIPGDDGAPGDDAMLIPGIQGAPGTTGGTGPMGPWIMSDDGNTGDDGMPMPGIQGIQGIQGPAGSGSGGQSGVIWPDDGASGDDGMMILSGPQWGLTQDRAQDTYTLTFLGAL